METFAQGIIQQIMLTKVVRKINIKDHMFKGKESRDFYPRIFLDYNPTGPFIFK